MDVRTDEIAPDIFRLSFQIGSGAEAFTFNQFLIRAQEPMLFHTGQKQAFPAVSGALSKLIDLEDLRWISFGHFEADECGALNEFLAASPHAKVAHSGVACMTSLNDYSERPPIVLEPGQVIDLGDRRLRQIETPHFPHAWESQLFIEETTSTLFSSDVGTQMGEVSATDEWDILQRAIDAEESFKATSLTPATAPTLRMLADLNPKTVAIMHGSSFVGDGSAFMSELAGYYQSRFQAFVASFQ